VRVNGASGPWLLRMTPGVELRIDVAGGRWAGFECPLESADPEESLDALAAQAGWPGGVRRVRARRLGCLRADVPLLGDTASGRDWMVHQLRAACVGTLHAVEAGNQGFKRAQAHAPGTDPELLAYECTAAGWQARVQPNGTARIDFDVRGSSRTVVLQPRGADVRVRVALASEDLKQPGFAGRQAAALLLARAAVALRWARPFAELDGECITSIGFECLLAVPVYARALLLAVDTLVAACDLFGRELEVLLEDADLASRYLALHDSAEPTLQALTSSTGVVDLTAPTPDAAVAAIA
jgi:hypothetical protein